MHRYSDTVYHYAASQQRCDGEAGRNSCLSLPFGQIALLVAVLLVQSSEATNQHRVDLGVERLQDSKNAQDAIEHGIVSSIFVCRVKGDDVLYNLLTISYRSWSQERNCIRMQSNY